MSHRIPHSHSRSRPSCPHRHPGPGCRPLALIWPILTRAAMSSSPVSDVVPVVPVDLLSETNWFVPRSPQLLPVSTEVVDPGVVESPELCSDMSTITSHSNPRGHRYLWRVWTRWSPTPYDAPVVPLDISPVADHLATCDPQESQVGTCRQCNCYLIGCARILTLLMYSPVFPVSPRTNGYLSRVSPVSSPGSPAAPAAGSLLDEETGSYHSVIGSPATSLSSTYHAANLQLLSEPLTPLPDAVLLHTDPAMLLELTHTYHDFLPS